MRIVIVTDQYPPMVGGVATVTHHLSTDLAARGHQVWVVAPSEDRHNERQLEAQVRIYRYSSFEWPAYEGQRIALLPIKGLHQLFKKIAPDVVHIHSPLVLGNLALLLAHALHIVVVATNHFMPINISRTLSGDSVLGRSFSKMAYSYLVSFYRRCEFVTAPTFTALNLLRKHGLRTPGEVVSNGINLARFRPGPRDEELRRAFGLPEDRPLALDLTRLMGEKRVDILLEALVQVEEPLHLIIGGTGPDADELQALSARLGIQDRVTFLGFVSDEHLVALYQLADFFVMPSVAELQSLATLEAMACGRPVVAADAGALPELVRPGQNGVLFRPDDSAHLAMQLRAMLNQRQGWPQMGEWSVRIAANHDRLAVLEQWEHLYSSLVIPQKSCFAAGAGR